MRTPPTGIVTFLFTDIEGYTRGFEAAPAAMARAVARHDACVRGAAEEAGGVVFKTIGDAYQIAFSQPQQALAGAVAAQRALAAEDWAAIDCLPGGLRVRMAVDVIVAAPHDGDYRTPGLNRIARLMASGHGGQVLLTGDAVVALADRIRAGVTLRPLGAHRLKDLREPVTAFQIVADGMPDVTTPLRTAGPLTTRDRIVVIDPHASDGLRAGAVVRPVDALFADLLAVVRGQAETAQLSMAEVRQLVGHRPVDETEYRLIRLAEWSQPRFQLDNRFVALTMWVDQGEQAANDRWLAAPERYDDLGELMQAVPDTALVVLGPPGSGKSTLLRRLELDLAIDGLRGPEARRDAVGARSIAGADEAGASTLTWFVPLNQYRAEADASRAEAGGVDPADPAAWLAERWAVRYPALPPLGQLIAAGRMTLLLDGLNEVPHGSPEAYRRIVRRWQRYVADFPARAPGTRVVFSCRSLDYSAPLSTPELRVPQVVVEPMSDGQIRAFLDAYAPSLALELWDQLTERSQLSLVRSPFLARLLVEQALREGTHAKSQAALITGFVRQALRREIERDNPLLEPDTLLTERDVKRLTAGGWPGAFDLPERGALVGRVAALAHAMQAGSARADGGQVHIDYDAALAAVAHPRAADIVHAGIDLGWLDEDIGADALLFVHQLLQEYFAARAFAAQPEVMRLRAAWRADETGADLAALVAGLPEVDPLPPLPTSGWEETAVMAAAMSADPAALVQGVMDVNLALAGRCAAQPDVQPRLPDDVGEALRRALAARTEDLDADLRARIAAGRALGPLGDPRFERRVGPFGSYLLPPLVAIPAGTYPIGDDAPIEWTWAGESESDTDHVPRHMVAVGAFSIQRFPVTNAEWACFMAAGGYDDERWWATDDGRRWRRGDLGNFGARTNNRAFRRRFLAEPALFETMVADGRFPSAEVIDRWRRWLAMDDAAFEAALAAQWRSKPETAPAFWQEARSNHPVTPVLGVCWYEAQAYASWLAAQTGQPFRLPTEVEWEAAARGQAGRAYPWGDAFDPFRANVAATRLKRSTPVGAFPGGDTPEGVADLAGNVSEWTSSLYGSGEDDARYSYPYVPTYGREDPAADASIRRVVRGGSWLGHRVSARAVRRLGNTPDVRLDDLGFRLAVRSTGPIPRTDGLSAGSAPLGGSDSG